jgi:5-methyltetrahydrofolate--homocysteine methyltransferase
MIYVAQELERQKLNIPLMIGGATTSRAHTAVKIYPEYSGIAVHVNDASRSVPIAQTLVTKTAQKDFKENLSTEYTKLRDGYLKKSSSKTYLSLEQAQNNKLNLSFDSHRIKKPNFLGVKTVEVELKELVPYIDWTPFFMTWELHGKFPRLLEDEVVGKEAKALYEDAQAMLNELVEYKPLTAKGVFGIFQANSVQDDIEFIHNSESERFLSLRQQSKKAKGAPNMALSDFISPKENETPDYIGCFAVTAGLGIETLVAEYEADHDDYKSIMVKALADRLAEAFAEKLHQDVRTEHWGYSKNETLSNVELIKEAYQGIRPAPGYPACPDHLEKQTIFKVLEPEKIGMQLTESLAMYPAASVSGYYLAHPDSKYFGLGKIGKDQMQDYAKRRGISEKDAEKWLRPSLNY